MRGRPTRIVRATEADLPAIAELAGVIWRACYPGIISPAQIEYMLGRMYALGTLRAEIQGQGMYYDQLFVGGELAGFAAHGPTEDAAVYKLHKLYLHPVWHGQGLGRRLLEHCQREARKRKARRLILSVNKRNSKAIAAYERSGFAVAESVVTDIGGGFVMDDFIMANGLV